MREVIKQGMTELRHEIDFELRYLWWLTKNKKLANRTPVEIWNDVLAGSAPVYALDNLLAAASYDTAR